MCILKAVTKIVDRQGQRQRQIYHDNEYVAIAYMPKKEAKKQNEWPHLVFLLDREPEDQLAGGGGDGRVGPGQQEVAERPHPEALAEVPAVLLAGHDEVDQRQRGRAGDLPMTNLFDDMGRREEKM
eukprot:scaffold96887_cov20-Prasinocladus_malaysianus.AAC.2